MWAVWPKGWTRWRPRIIHCRGGKTHIQPEPQKYTLLSTDCRDTCSLMSSHLKALQQSLLGDSVADPIRLTRMSKGTWLCSPLLRLMVMENPNIDYNCSNTIHVHLISSTTKLLNAKIMSLQEQCLNVFYKNSSQFTSFPSWVCPVL